MDEDRNVRCYEGVEQGSPVALPRVARYDDVGATGRATSQDCLVLRHRLLVDGDTTGADSNTTACAVKQAKTLTETYEQHRKNDRSDRRTGRDYVPPPTALLLSTVDFFGDVTRQLT
jgi:hypothetical protein